VAKKRVHEIAKAQGVSSKELLAALKAAGVEAKAAASSVEEADALVANAVKRIAELFADERAKLEKQWDRGGEVSTEDLRQALRRYRGFFDRLLSFQ